MLIDRTFGVHYHALYGDSELVIGVNPVRVIQGDVPAWVQEWALDWVREHEGASPSGWKTVRSRVPLLARRTSLSHRIAPRGCEQASSEALAVR